MGVETLTFGCRLNAYESEVMKAEAEKAGLDGALLVKRVARIGLDLHIASDNPAAPVMPLVRADRAHIVGRVVRLARSLI